MRKLILYPLILLAGLLVGIYASDGALWTLVAGPPDMGRADFDRTKRPTNEFVACSSGADCAQPDLELQALRMPLADALERIDAILAVDGERIDDGSDPLHRRYVVRTRWLRFPDTVSVEAAPLQGGTALRLSSRSQIGVDDLGANEARLRALVAELGLAVSPAG